MRLIRHGFICFGAVIILPLVVLVLALSALGRKPSPLSHFFEHVPPAIARQASRSAINRELLAEYGSMFVARGVRLPPVLVFRSDAQAARWQAQVPQATRRWSNVAVTLQPRALAALAAARAQARRLGLRLEPRGADASRRTYLQTVRLWESRVRPALAYWQRRGRLNPHVAARIRRLAPAAQVPVVLRLERHGIWFSTDFNKTILDSVAAPGSSQHLALLAFDLREYSNPRLWRLLAAHGWYQTIPTDLPHFTYLGWRVAQLPRLGLRLWRAYGHRFWIPALPVMQPKLRPGR